MEVGDIVKYNNYIAKVIQEVGGLVVISYQEFDKPIQTIKQVSKASLTIGEK